MKAVVYDRYGGPEVLRIEDVETPIPGEGEVLVRVATSAVNAADWRTRKADPWFMRLMTGLTRPKHRVIPGFDFAGVIESVGEGVSRFSPGDRVFGMVGFVGGAHAEFVVSKAEGLIALIPGSLDFATAVALLFGGGSACSFYDMAGGVKAGDKVLVYGASGACGTYAVQLAKLAGAEVTAVCSAANRDLMFELGADHVIDYAAEDFAAAGPVYDKFIETVGKTPFGKGLGCVKRGGAYLMIAGPVGVMAFKGLISSLSKKQVVAGVASPSSEDIVRLAEMAADGRLKAFIDRRFAFEDVAEAHRLAESGRKRGTALLEVSPALAGP